MCDPVSIIGGLISVGASAMQAQQQAAFVNAQNNANKHAYEISKQAREAEQARQDAYEKQASDYWNTTADNLTVDDHNAERTDAADKFMQNFDDLPTTQPEGQMLSGQKFANTDIQQEIASRANTAAADARRRVQALAKLSAYGTADASRNIKLGSNADLLTTLNGIRRGSLAVSNQEQNIAPAQVSQGDGTFADILSGVGGIVSGMGGTKTPAAAQVVNSGGYSGIY